MCVYIGVRKGQEKLKKSLYFEKLFPQPGKSAFEDIHKMSGKDHGKVKHIC